jgi:EAL domain-containing protein (putative c-di-GMP-specific phosphodiesterase class I)
MNEMIERADSMKGVRFHARLSDTALGVLSDIESESDLKIFLDQMYDHLAREYHTSEKSVKVNIVIGATLIAVSEDYHDVLVDAHRACDFAWRNKQKFHVYQSVQQEIVENVNAEWGRKIQSAIDNGNLVLYFQPIVTIHGAHEEKYDVLVRLSDDSNMIFEAQRFIPAAEATGLIRPIDEWVLHQSLRVLRRKRKDDPHTVFFIKLSVASLADEKFVSYIIVSIEKADIPPSSVVIEFKQKDASSRLAEIRTNLIRLARHGVKLAIEHFGADLSSSDLLNTLPVDYIKIDGAFMCDLATNHANLSTVKSLAGMASKKGVQTIATYVENADSLALLWNSGVGYTQGYFLSQPGASLDFEFPEQ